MGTKLYTSGPWLVLKQRLKDFGIEKRGEKTKLAKHLDIHEGQITKWIKNIEPSYSMGKKIERYLEAGLARRLLIKAEVAKKFKRGVGL